MKYNMHVLARTYLKGFYKFLIKHTTIRSSKDAYSLFIYSVKKLYMLETTEFNKAIEKYGDSCIKYLGDLNNTPKYKDKLSLEDKVSLVSLCEAYSVATDLLTYNRIRNSRIEKVTPYLENRKN